MDLLQRTYDLIDKSGLSQRQIAAGAGVKRDWLAKFAQRRIRSPGTPKVQAVHNFLRSYKPPRSRGHAESPAA
jgi:transcriptional regulator with XRE-family HTH domain